jgi:prepilin-type N-terminal cleavage/methylation domain-containing protein
MRIFRAGVCNSRGFTMVELAMVMLVIGIIGAVTLPRFGGVLDRHQLRRTVNTMRGAVRYLHARAALTKRIYRLVFDLDKQRIWYCYLDRVTNDCQAERTNEFGEYDLPETVRIVDVTDPQGKKIREGEAMTHFHPTGWAEPSTIHLRGGASRQMTIRIEPLAGSVQVLDGYVDPETKTG